MDSHVVEARIAGHCTCHSIRERSDGATYSLWMLGVNCGYCEAVIAEEEHRDWYEGLSAAERIAHDIAGRWAAATWRIRDMRRPGAPRGFDPPF